MKAMDYVRFYLRWIGLSVLMFLNLVILALLGIGYLIATLVGRQKAYRQATRNISTGIYMEAKRVF